MSGYSDSSIILRWCEEICFFCGKLSTSVFREGHEFLDGEVLARVCALDRPRNQGGNIGELQEWRSVGGHGLNEVLRCVVRSEDLGDVAVRKGY